MSKKGSQGIEIPVFSCFYFSFFSLLLIFILLLLLLLLLSFIFMGSSQSKRTKELSTGSSYGRSVVNKIADSPVTCPRSTLQQHSLRTKSSFIRTSSSPNSSQSSAKHQKQQQKQQQVASVNNPPVFAGVQSNSFFLPKNWQAEDADHGVSNLSPPPQFTCFLFFDDLNSTLFFFFFIHIVTLCPQTTLWLVS